MENHDPVDKQSGWAAPLDATEAAGRSRMILGGAAGLLAVCTCLALVVGGLLAIDPFNWQIVDRLTGRYDPAASAMPQETALYIGIDVLALSPQRIDRVIGPFLEAASQPDVSNTEDALDEFDRKMASELDITFQDDIMPWLGQYAGLGILNIEFDLGGDVRELSFIAAITTRNRRASDAFLERLAAGVTESTGSSFSQESYKGTTIYVMDTDDPLERLAFGRHDGLVLIGTGLTAIQQAIDVPAGRSLAADDSYRAVIGELPGGRGLTFYLDGGRYEEIVDGLSAGSGAGLTSVSLGAIDFDSAALALSIIDEGLQLDIASSRAIAQIDEATRELVAASPASDRADQRFPEQTVVLITGRRLDLTWAAIRQGFVSDNAQADWDEAMDLFRAEFLVNPDTELLNYLDGEWGLGLLPAGSGLLADELDISLGFAWLIGTNDPAGLSPALNNLAAGVDFLGLTIQQQPLADGFAYDLSLSAGDEPLLTYGIEGNQMFLASDLATASQVLSAEGLALASSDRYRQVWSAFPRGHTQLFYLDLQGLLGAAGLEPTRPGRVGQITTALAPLTFVAATSDAEVAGDALIRHISTIFFIESTE
jgi:hypothetical protein